MDRDYYTAHHCLSSVIFPCFENLNNETFLKFSIQPTAISNFETSDGYEHTLDSFTQGLRLVPLVILGQFLKVGRW